MVTLETTYLVEMNKFELVYIGNGKKNIKNERMFGSLILINITKNRSALESAENYKENRKNECRDDST